MFTFVEWQRFQQEWVCPSCQHRLDLHDTIVMCSTYRPERNSAELPEVVRIIRHNLGLPPIPPKPVVQPNHPRSFWHPKEFATNLAVGTAMEIGWRLMGIARDLVGQIGDDDG
jgi:hypothetical protein